MATFRSRSRRDLLRTPTTKKPSKKTSQTRKKKPTKRLASAPQVTSAKARADAAIHAIRDAMADANAQYYAIGKALIGLRKPAIWKLYAATTFRHFLNENVMPYSTALRMITIAESYPQKLALEIGMERSFQLARLARIDPDIAKAPAVLWRTNAKLGERRVQTLSAADLERLAKGAQLRANQSKAKAAKPSTRDKSVLSSFKKTWQSTFGRVKASIRFDPKKRTVHVQFNLDDLLD